MKIALVITELDPGGAERNLTKLAIGFRNRGHETVVISIASKPANTLLHDRLSSQQINVIYLNCNSRWLFLLAWLRLYLCLRREIPDIVQSFLYHANLLTSLCNRRRRFRHYVGLRVKDPRSSRYQRLAKYQRRWAGVICVSDEVLEKAASFFTVPDLPVYCVPNGVDLDALGQTDRTWPQDVPEASKKLNFIGRLDNQKGLDYLLNGVPRLLSKYPDCELYILGDGPLHDWAEQQIESTDYSDRIHLLGYRDDAQAFLANATLFLFPSRWEGMPNAVMEAMAHGVPVISTPVDGIAPLLGHDQRQITSVDVWANAADALLQLPPEELEQIGQANRQVIGDHFTSRQMIDTYLQLYSSEDVH